MFMYEMSGEVKKKCVRKVIAQLEERQSSEWKGVSSNPGQIINHACCEIHLSVQVIASLGGDVKLLALSPSSLCSIWKET